MNNTGSERNHYFLVAGEISFVRKDKPNTFEGTCLNGVVVNDTPQFPARCIGRAQQVLQMQFFKRLGENVQMIEVTDVVLVNVTYLGEFTSEEFNANPDAVNSGKAANDVN